MIEGLKISLTGGEVRALLEQRIADHLRRAEHWKRQQARTPAGRLEDAPMLPDEMCENEAERHEWRADVLGFMRDHIDSEEVYRLGEADLTFAELLPCAPGWLDEDEY